MENWNYKFSCHLQEDRSDINVCACLHEYLYPPDRCYKERLEFQISLLPINVFFRCMFICLNIHVCCILPGQCCNATMNGWNSQFSSYLPTNVKDIHVFV